MDGREPLELLRVVRGLIDAGWCRGALARDAYARPVEVKSRRAIRFDLVGAVKRAAQQLGRNEMAEVGAVRHLLAPFCGTTDVGDWNDRQIRKSQVLAVIDKAIAAAETRRSA